MVDGPLQLSNPSTIRPLLYTGACDGKDPRMKLTREDPWLRRFAAWIDERFPPVQGILFLTLYALALLSGRAFAEPGALAVGLRDLVGFLGFYAFFLLLRIVDEHKDFEADGRNFPRRVLQRGLIGLADLRWIGAAAFVLPGAVSLWLDGGFGAVTGLWLAVIVWGTLAAVEFFAGAFLRPRLVLYAAVHMLIMPLVVAWAMAVGSPKVPLGGLALLAALAYCSGFVFEIGRKIKAPEDERETVDSYSRRFGPRGAARVMVALLVAANALLAVLVWRFGGGAAPVVAGLLAALLAVGSVAAMGFSARPTRRRAKRLETSAVGTVLAGYLLVIVVLLADRGWLWV